MLIVAMALAPLPTATRAQDALYALGTDIGAKYLSEHSKDLWLSLKLQECGKESASAKVGRNLPNSVRYALSEQGKTEKEADNVALLVAQITRSYLLGYEVGVRTQHRRLNDDGKAKECASVVASD
ncbi:MAG: hypothetical protein C0519_01380 [Hyphomicrobium sp.]|nr:hypothetical protein [Hyphomicrobium sp.]